MLDSIFSASASLSVGQMLLATLCALAMGAAVAFIYMFKSQYTKSFVCTLAIMPAMTALVIMMVNGNVGTGVAVMGAFSLIRFRSVAGSAREIGAIFLAMGLGLCVGAGYLLLGVLFLALIGGAMLLMTAIGFGKPRQTEKELKISIPESLDYTGLFDDLLNTYTTQWSLERVRTTNMGSLYELCYHVQLPDATPSKAFLDELRCRNGNLNISLGRVSTARDEL